MIDSSLQQHPLSAAFPPLTADEYQTLVDSITDLGVQNAITIYQGQVLDGWNRYRAAVELDLDCPTRELESWIDPRSFVLAQNKARRHITAAQLIAAASKIYEWKPLGANQHTERGSALSADPQSSSKQLAETLGVGVRSVEQFRAVQRNAAPEVVQAVERGDVGLPKAAAIAKLPKEQQAAALVVPLAPVPAAAPAAPKKQAKDEPRPSVQDQSALQIHALEEEIAALREQLAEAREEIAALSKLMDAAEPVTAAVAEAKKYRDLARGLQTRIDGLMTQVASLTGDVKHWKRKAEVPA